MKRKPPPHGLTERQWQSLLELAATMTFDDDGQAASDPRVRARVTNWRRILTKLERADARR